MKRIQLAACILLCCLQQGSAESVSIPWPDFQKLYEAHIKKRILEALPKEPAPQRHVIDTVVYDLQLSGDGATGTVTLAGQHLGGNQKAIPLFGGDFVLTEAKEVSGATLIGTGDAYPIGLIPLGNGPFSATLSFMIPARADKQHTLISIEGPAALSRSLKCTLSKETILLDAPGIRDASGTYRLAANDRLHLRVATKSEHIAATNRIEVDLISVLQVGNRELYGTTYLVSGRQAAHQYVLTLPEGARWLDASIPSSPVPNRANTFELQINRQVPNTPMSVRWAMDLEQDDLLLRLPTIADNRGEQGRFLITAPSHVKTAATGTGLVAGIPATGLPPRLQAVIGPETPYYRINPSEAIGLSIQRFKAIDMPQTVLDEVHLHVAFDDNGGILSRLRMLVPSREGSLRLKAIKDATIWALTVNGDKASPYVGPDGEWIIPLAQSGTSSVELTFLREGSKLGLHGRIEALVPATGLPTKKLLVNATLPDRLDVISMEGPVSAETNPQPQLGDSARTKKAYSFSRAYHDGAAVSVALFYKEPVREE